MKNSLHTRAMVVAALTLAVVFSDAASVFAGKRVDTSGTTGSEGDDFTPHYSALKPDLSKAASGDLDSIGLPEDPRRTNEQQADSQNFSVRYRLGDNTGPEGLFIYPDPKNPTQTFKPFTLTTTIAQAPNMAVVQTEDGRSVSDAQYNECLNLGVLTGPASQMKSTFLLFEGKLFVKTASQLNGTVMGSKNSVFSESPGGMLDGGIMPKEVAAERLNFQTVPAPLQEAAAPYLRARRLVEHGIQNVVELNAQELHGDDYI